MVCFNIIVTDICPTSPMTCWLTAIIPGEINLVKLPSNHGPRTKRRELPGGAPRTLVLSLGTNKRVVDRLYAGHEVRNDNPFKSFTIAKNQHASCVNC